MAATTTLTLGLVLRGVASDPYQSTREATAGPDVVASVMPDARGRRRPTSPASRHWPALPASSTTAGRTRSPAPRSRHRRADGGRAGRGARHRAGRRRPARGDRGQLGPRRRRGGRGRLRRRARHAGVGDPVTLDGRSFEVVGIAVTAAMAPYPWSTLPRSSRMRDGATPEGMPASPPELLQDPGLVWLTDADVAASRRRPAVLRHEPEAGGPGRRPGVRRRAQSRTRRRCAAPGVLAGHPRAGHGPGAERAARC